MVIIQVAMGRKVRSLASGMTDSKLMTETSISYLKIPTRERTK